jgi:RNA:NAD 2'-phosphotransferase (TPT1/KptA family)
VTAAPRTLWHGTSAHRLDAIRRQGRIEPARIGHRIVSTSEDRSVAAYFAENSAKGSDDPVTEAVILEIDVDACEALGIRFESFSDPVWGEGHDCDWEKEWCTEVTIPMSCVRGIHVQSEEAATPV